MRVATSTPIYVKRWTATPQGERIDTTHSEAAGYETGITGIRNLSVEIEADDDGAANLFDAGMTAGATIACKLYLNGTAGPYWNLTLHVESAPMNADVKSAMGIRFTGKANGSFSYPTTAAGSTS